MKKKKKAVRRKGKAAIVRRAPAKKAKAKSKAKAKAKTKVRAKAKPLARRAAKPRPAPKPPKAPKARAMSGPPEPALNAGAAATEEVSFGLPTAPEPGSIPGVDTPANAAPQLACLTAAGKRFIARYYARGNRPKIIRRDEAQAISGAGLSIVAVWESGFPTTVDYFARAQGNADGADAHQRATEIGQPRDTPIYFAVDYDADPAHVTGPIAEYFKGIAEGLAGAAGGTARYAVGCYGSGIVCTAIKAAGLASFTWLAQSRGWRGYADFTAWNIRQGPVTKLCTLDVDGDEGREPFGEFQVV